MHAIEHPPPPTPSSRTSTPTPTVTPVPYPRPLARPPDIANRFSSVHGTRTSEKDPEVVRDFTIITGQGKHSRRAFEPVLRPAAQDMFLEEFDPPMVSRFEPKNLGRLKVGKVGEGGRGGLRLGRREGGRGRGVV